MLESGFMSPLLLRSSDRNVQGGGCDVATREKTVVFLFTNENYCRSEERRVGKECRL